MKLWITFGPAGAFPALFARGEVVFDEALKDVGAGTKKLGFGETAPTGERWITVHPWGGDEKGVPVLVRVNPHNPRQGRVVGGAGGKLNLKRINLKTPEEYKQQAAKKARERRERDRSERGTSRAAARKGLREQHDEHSRSIIHQIAEQHGLPTEPAEADLRGLDERASARARAQHARTLERQVNALARNARKLLVDSATARAEAQLGEVGYHGTDEALGAEDVLTDRELRGGLGYQAETEALTDEEATAAKVGALTAQLEMALGEGDEMGQAILGQRIARATELDDDALGKMPDAALAGVAKVAAERLRQLDSAVAAEHEAAASTGQPPPEDPIPDEDREALDDLAEAAGGGLKDVAALASTPDGRERLRNLLDVAARHGLLKPETAESLAERERAARYAAAGVPDIDQVDEDAVDGLEGPALDLLVDEAARTVRATPGTDADLRDAAAAVEGDVEAVGRDRNNLAEEGLVVGELTEPEKREFVKRAVKAGLVGAGKAASGAGEKPPKPEGPNLRVTDGQRARDILLAHRKLKASRAALQRGQRAIDRGETVEGLDYDPGVEPSWKATRGGAQDAIGDAHPEAGLIDDIEGEIRTQRARGFLEGLDKTYQDVAGEAHLEPDEVQGDIGRHLSWGANDAIARASREVLQDVTIDRQTIDLLGAEGAANLLAWQIHQTRGADAKAIADATGDYHLHLQDTLIPQAEDEAREAYEHAHEIAAGMRGEAARDLGGWRAMNKQRIARLDDARKTLGRALGHLETTAALHAAMRRGPPKQIVSQLGQMSEEQAVAHAKAAGLGPEDYEIDSDGTNTWLTVKPSGFPKMVRPHDPEGARLHRDMAAIKRGDHDEEGWMPAGFSRRSDPPPPPDERPPEHAQPLDHALKDHGSYDEAIRTFVAQRVHDGWRPVDIAHDLQRTAHHEAQIRDAHGDTEHPDMAAWQAANPEPDKTAGTTGDMFGGGGDDVTPAWQRWDDQRQAAASAPHVRAFYDALNRAMPARESLGGDKPADVTQLAERYGPAFREMAQAQPGQPDAPGLHEQEVDEQIAHEASYRALARHPAAVAAFKSPGDLTHAEQAALREAFVRYTTPRADDEAAVKADPARAVAGWTAQNPEPPREDQNASLFGAMGIAEQHSPEAIAQAREKAEQAEGAHDEAYGAHHAAEQGLHAATERLRAARTGGKQGEIEQAEEAHHEATGKHAEAGRQRMEAAAAHEKARDQAEAMAHADASPEWRAWNKQRGEAERTARADAGKHGAPDWSTYVATHGSAEAAYRAAADLVRSRFLDDFRGHYEAAAGKRLRSGITAIDGADRHRIAFDPDWREHVAKVRGQAQAQVQDRGAQGKFIADQVRAKRDRKIQENQARAERQTSALDAPAERPTAPGHGERVTLGERAEQQIGALVNQHAEYVDPQATFAARSAAFSGDEQKVKRQRAIRAIERGKKLGVFVSTGGGKTSIALGALTHLRGRGKAKRGLMAVPSIVQGQFGGEALSFIEPGAMRWHAKPGASREERMAAYADPNQHAVIVTHQGLRDDVTHMLAAHTGLSARDVATKMTGFDEAGEPAEGWSREETDRNVRAALEAHGAHGLLDYLAVDEGHTALNRQGKRDSHLARVMDSLGRLSKHAAWMTGTPVKNDVSEMYDWLAKTASDKYHDGAGGVSRKAFMRRYGDDPVAAAHGLRDEMARHTFTAEVDPGVRPQYHHDKLQPTAEQSRALTDVEDAYQRARVGAATGRHDVEALKVLSPKSFEGVDDEGEITKRAASLGSALGTVRDTAINRVINTHADGAKTQRVVELATQYREQGRGAGVVFARNHEAVQNLHGALEQAGHRVITLTGRDTSKSKEAKLRTYNAGHADVIVLSDAGATGANLQGRATWLAHNDVPQTYMTWKQRTARIVRGGQQHAEPDVHTLVLDHDWEDQNQDRFERKRALHEALQVDAATHGDDNDLAHMIQHHVNVRSAAG